MSDKTFHIEGTCPQCGKKQQLQLTASQAMALEGATPKALEQGLAPKALAQCEECATSYEAPISANTCAEWDEFCQAVHPVQEV